MENFKPQDLVLVPFPFTDRAISKRRPALVLSSEDYTKDCGHLICAMVTTAKRSSWQSDIELIDWKQSGLPVASKVRFKLFTLDRRIVLRKLGRLTAADTQKVKISLKKVTP
jgi:mRNA interferase MazF